ncbi:MAG: putative glycosyl hydrolase, partial [Myxococcales bacterium]|nr:putative glycosyl hydrolase [Myxococcales bacterium]
SSGAAASPGNAGSSGNAGSTGRAGAGGAAAGAGGKPDGGAAGNPGSDAGPPPTDGGVPSKILIYCVTTGFHHASIPAAAKAIATVMKTAHGVDADQVSCDGKQGPPDPTKFTTAALAGYGAVILLANSGLPFGGTTMGKTEIENLDAFVKNGGGLVAIEDADHCYDGGFMDVPNQTYINLIGNDFGGHSGNGPATCRRADTDNNPAVAQLPTKAFAVSDEIYSNKAFNPLNNVVLKCTSSGGTEHIISYTREKTADTGNGRVFYTALGHNDVEWTAALDSSVANTRLTEDHVIPALLWTMHRL